MIKKDLFNCNKNEPKIAEIVKEENKSMNTMEV